MNDFFQQPRLASSYGFDTNSLLIMWMLKIYNKRRLGRRLWDVFYFVFDFMWLMEYLIQIMGRINIISGFLFFLKQRVCWLCGFDILFYYFWYQVKNALEFRVKLSFTWILLHIIMMRLLNWNQNGLESEWAGMWMG